MTQDQLKLIEDALCRSVPVVWTRKDETDRHAKALEIVRQALAQPANQSDCGHKEYKPLCQMCMATKQNPVAWVEGLEKSQPRCVTNLKYLSVAEADAGVQFIPLYTAPPKREWVGLTDEERVKCYETTGHYQTLRPQDSFAVLALARAIEAALRSKNNG